MKKTVKATKTRKRTATKVATTPRIDPTELENVYGGRYRVIFDGTKG